MPRLSCCAQGGHGVNGTIKGRGQRCTHCWRVLYPRARPNWAVAHAHFALTHGACVVYPGEAEECARARVGGPKLAGEAGEGNARGAGTFSRLSPRGSTAWVAGLAGPLPRHAQAGPRPNERTSKRPQQTDGFPLGILGRDRRVAEIAIEDIVPRLRGARIQISLFIA